jgi:hypothetical protein
MFKCTMVEYACHCPSLITVSVMKQQIYLMTKLIVTLRIQITLHHHTSLYSTYSFWVCILWTPFQREFGNCSTVLCNLHSQHTIWGVHSSDNSGCGLCWWPTFWTNILTLSCLTFPLDVAALCHFSTEKRMNCRWCENFRVYTLIDECLGNVLSVPGDDNLSVLNVWQ